MYSIYVDSKCIYNDMSPSKKNQIIKPKLVIEDNSAGSLTFTLPSNNEFTNDVKRIVSTVTVMKDGIEFWSGRVLDEDVDFYNNRTLYCEGELAYFNDSNQPPAEYHDITPRGLLETFVSIHNSQVEANKRFTVGAVTVTDPNDSLYRYTNYESTIEAIKTKLIDVLGGHLRIRKVNGVRYLDYLKDYPQVSTQQIHFGKNLLDFAKNYSMSDFVTVLLPKGAMINGEDYDSTSSYAVGDYCYYSNYIWRCKTAITSSETWNPAHWTKLQKYIPALTPYLTVEEVNNGSMYVVNSEAVDEYGWIVGVKEWDNVTDPNNLLTKAQEYLSKVQYDNLELEVTAVDLRLMDVKYDSLNLLDQIRVVSRPHGINMLFPIRKMEIPLEKPESTSFTLSLKEDTKSTNLSGTTSKSLSDLENNIENASNIHRQAIENVTALLNMSTNGYITILKNQNGTSEMLITDEKDWTRAQRIWRWNINGLGYSNDGGRTYGTAMTMDGSIVASYITSGTMTADRVRGGTFEVGGTSLGANGKILVKNSSGTTLITIDKNGITFSGGETIPYSAISDAPSIPSKTSELTNDSDWVTSTQATTITKDTVTTAFVNALNVTAKYISTKDLIATGISKIGGFVINDHYIQGFNNTNYNDSTIYCELGAWNPQWEQSGYAFAVWIRNNTSEQYKLKIGIRYDGTMVSESSLEVYPTDSTYGLWVHGKEYVEGDINLTGGLFTKYNVYAERNVSGAVVDGRTGLNAAQGGIYGGRDLYVEGSIGCGGSKNRVVTTKNYGYRNMNAYETATPYFGDIGEGTLNEDGECIIYLDDIFYECIDTDSNYQVFLQKYGQGNIWVDTRENNYFIVKGTPNMRFGWELKAIQRNYDSIRLDMPNDAMTRTIINQYADD